MSTFIERPLRGTVKGRPRQMIYGVGINDAPYFTNYIEESGQKRRCPFYSVWKSMLERVYSPKHHEKYPTYVGSSVTPDWLLFSNFRAWMITQDWKNKELDKDLLSYSEKHYSPETCLFISQAINKLLVLRTGARGKYPLGVSTSTIRGKTYITAFCSFNAKSKNLGYFNTVEEAAAAYKKAKLSYIKELASKETNPKIQQALLNIY